MLIKYLVTSHLFAVEYNYKLFVTKWFVIYFLFLFLIKNIYANTERTEDNTSIYAYHRNSRISLLVGRRINRVGRRSESHSTMPCKFLRLLRLRSFFFRASFFRILAAGCETTRCSLRVSCNFDERRIRERSLLYSPFFVAAQWADDFSFLLSHDDLLLLSCGILHSRRIKLQPFSTKIERCESTSLSLRELF